MTLLQLSVVLVGMDQQEPINMALAKSNIEIIMSKKSIRYGNFMYKNNQMVIRGDKVAYTDGTEGVLLDAHEDGNAEVKWYNGTVSVLKSNLLVKV